MNVRFRSGISETTTIAELLALDTKIAEIFQRHGLGDCLGCAMAEFDTLSDAAREYGANPDAVLREIACVKGREK